MVPVLSRNKINITLLRQETGKRKANHHPVINPQKQTEIETTSQKNLHLQLQTKGFGIFIKKK